MVSNIQEFYADFKNANLTKWKHAPPPKKKKIVEIIKQTKMGLSKIKKSFSILTFFGAHFVATISLHFINLHKIQDFLKYPLCNI